MPRQRPLQRQRGSAYILALLILVVLTLIGLSVALITGTEAQVGANERLIQRTFYAADSGVGLVLARILTKNDFSEGTPDDPTNPVYELNPAPGSESPLVRNQVTLSPSIPLLEAPCSLCEINNAGTYSETAYWRYNVAVTTRGQRTAAADPTSAVADNTISANLDVQPWQVDPNAYAVLGQLPPEELAEKVKF